MKETMFAKSPVIGEMGYISQQTTSLAAYFVLCQFHCAASMLCSDTALCVLCW